MRDYGPTEVGCFGISARDDLLLVEDVRLVQQTCTATTVAFDDAAVADFFDEQVDHGISPERFGRIWIHTHPGTCPLPSPTDEGTFARCFSGPDWALMFILARGGRSYARLRFRAGPGGQLELSVGVDYSQPFGGSNHAGWAAAYERWVTAAQMVAKSNQNLPEESLDGFHPLFREMGGRWRRE
jgi:hypothetical protein